MEPGVQQTRTESCIITEPQVYHGGIKSFQYQLPTRALYTFRGMSLFWYCYVFGKRKCKPFRPVPSFPHRPSKGRNRRVVIKSNPSPQARHWGFIGGWELCVKKMIKSLRKIKTFSRFYLTQNNRNISVASRHKSKSRIENHNSNNGQIRSPEDFTLNRRVFFPTSI